MTGLYFCCTGCWGSRCRKYWSQCFNQCCCHSRWVIQCHHVIRNSGNCIRAWCFFYDYGCIMKVTYTSIYVEHQLKNLAYPSIFCYPTPTPRMSRKFRKLSRKPCISAMLWRLSWTAPKGFLDLSSSGLDKITSYINFLPQESDFEAVSEALLTAFEESNPGIVQ